MMNGRSLDDYVTVSVDITFEAKYFACDYCPLLETYARKQCRMTGQYITDGRARGWKCPFEVTPEQRDAITKANFSK